MLIESIDSYLNDRLKIKNWCIENLSPSEFWRYLSLDDSHRQIFEECFWRGYIEGYEKGHEDGMGALADDPSEWGSYDFPIGPESEETEQD